MERFPDGEHVKLESRVYGGYLHADDEPMRVPLRAHGESLGAVWAVRHLVRDGVTYLLLHSAASGRYLAAYPDPAPPGCLGHGVVLVGYDDDESAIRWRAVASEDAGYVLLRHGSSRLLRANGENSGVTIDHVDSLDPVAHWRVENLAAPPAAEIGQFADGAHVRLMRSLDRCYLHADHDGVHARFIPLHGSLSFVWRVQRVLRGGTILILLQSSAYGHYLGCSHGPSSNFRRMLVHDRYYSSMDQEELLWEVAGGQGNDISLLNRRLKLVHLVVEFISTRNWPPPTIPAPTAQQELFFVIHQEGLFQRLVIFLQGDDFGNIDFRSAQSIWFVGRSISQLRNRLAYLMEERFAQRLIMCIWSGAYGRLILLTCDLPANNQTLEVVFFNSWSQAALSLHYPIIGDHGPAY